MHDSATRRELIDWIVEEATRLEIATVSECRALVEELVPCGLTFLTHDHDPQFVDSVVAEVIPRLAARGN